MNVTPNQQTQSKAAQASNKQGLPIINKKKNTNILSESDPSTSNGPMQQERTTSPSDTTANHHHHHRRSNSSESSLTSRIFAPAAHWYDEMRWTRENERTNASKRWVLIISYCPDWVITVLTAGLLQIINNVYGFRREFSLTDTSIQHTYAIHERISTGLLAVLAFIIPLIIIAIFSLGLSRSFWDFHAGFLGLVVAQAFTLTATTIIKVCVGRPRPDFIDRCQPRNGSENGIPFGLVTQDICTTNTSSHLIQDGFRSFPSGHSSTAFAGLTFLTLWLAGKFHLWQRGRGNAFASWILFIPMLGATLIAVSRTMDYRHHATDVIAGGVLGFIIALSAYHNYYPPLFHFQSHKPWTPRTSLFKPPTEENQQLLQRQENQRNHLNNQVNQNDTDLENNYLRSEDIPHPEFASRTLTNRMEESADHHERFTDLPGSGESLELSGGRENRNSDSRQ